MPPPSSSGSLPHSRKLDWAGKAMVPRKNKKKRANAAKSTQPPMSLSEKKTPLSLKPKLLKKSTSQNPAQEKGVEVTRKVQGKDKNTTLLSLSEKRTPQSLEPRKKRVKKFINQNPAQEKGAEATHKVQGRDENATTTKDKRIKIDSKRNDGSGLRIQSSQHENKEKHNESNQRDPKAKRNLGGLIFMCNRKTKSDCYRYQVMGVSNNKQEVVMGIKPGLMLFLYDFDLRLLYGIYKASSAGGIKLEPAAFAGAFPAQVRFKVHKDCQPLPESIFKKAIKDNYNNKTNKFKTELTIEQVKKLTQLFQHVPSMHSDVNSSIQEPLSNTPLPAAYLPGEEVRVERLYSDHYICSKPVAGYHMPLDHGRQISEHYIPHNNVTSVSPLFLSEKEYRSYGLRGEKGYSMGAAVPLLALDSHGANREREQLHMRTASIDGDETLPHKMTDRPDELFLSEKEYRTYGLRGKYEVPRSSSLVEYRPSSTNYPEDVYNPYHYSTASLVNHYLSLPKASAAAPESYNVAWRETQLTDRRNNPGRVPPDEGERLYSTYATRAVLDHNERYHHLGDEYGSRSTPVSSRYSFAGPSVSYR